ncbi:hypothetical protein NNJEOMEG_03928 [Fundidesulfovibrio magnetotacticus]|uniref:Tetratricopeptide repeat protein n=1 Tax=Fundidesulfovibrio magnetotacticus TaxID=2730080 RepID=A0A6V8LWE3_9BACT|nr:tetratricopeptide repeat protein [Fundidesulfovibrio magnetotacticus]GFK96054.1 hypothetical protein NNJEOMEG_03928 [Fundidesulfovibrio magnetotacticus]
MTLKTSIGSKGSPKAMFASFVNNVSTDSKPSCSSGGCKGSCRASALTRLNREGMAACQAGDYGVAERLLEKGIDLANRCGSKMYVAKLRNNLGLVHLLAGRPLDASGQFWQALELVEGKLGRDNPLFRRIEGNLLRASGN